MPSLAFGGSAVLLLAFAAPPSDQPAEVPASHSLKPELVATGFEFADGPAFDADGDLFVVNYRGNGNIGRIAPDGTAGVFCNLRTLLPAEEREPRASGLKVDATGRLIVADAGAGRLLRITADGMSGEVLADRCNGDRFNAINDVCLDRAGNIFFTDPAAMPSVENPTGVVYRYDIATKVVTKLDEMLAYPNGIAVSPDQQRLYVGESLKFHVLQYDLVDGAAMNRRVLIEFPRETTGAIIGGEHLPDGMIFDAAGRLYVAMWTGGVINVVDTNTGQLVRQYDAGGSRATNCHFFNSQLYVTVAAKEAVFRLPLGVKGFDYNNEP